MLVAQRMLDYVGGIAGALVPIAPLAKPSAYS